MSNRIHHWLESKEGPPAERIIRREASPESFLDNLPRQFPQSSSSRRTSTASSGSGSRYTSATDASSRKSSASTVASSAPSLYGPLPIADYYLHCPFEILGCDIRFLPNAVATWIAHSLSHFVEVDPPMKSICTICDDGEFVFEASGKGRREREERWRLRMEHIAGHLSRGETSVRADYYLVEYMHDQGLLSDEDFDFVMDRSLSERPSGHQRFVTKGFKTPEARLRERKGNIIVQDQRREDHQRRKQMRQQIV